MRNIMKFENLFPDIGIETKEVEFKDICNEGIDPKTGESLQVRWLKTIIAFANGDGGDMYVGIEDRNHTVVALDKEKADQQMNLIRREAKQSVIPSLFLDPVALPISFKKETRYLIKVHVNPSNNVPVMLKAHNAYCTFIRKYGSTEIATPEEIRALVLSREETSFDILPSDITYDPSKFCLMKEEYRKNHEGEELFDKTLQLRGFFDAKRYLKRGSLLFEDDYDGDKTNITLAKWPGFDRGSDSLVFLKKLKGPMSKVIHESADIVSMISANGIQKTSSGQRDYLSYPYRSVFEGIANAFAHRNYWKIGTQIQVDMFPDRLEITSPGSLLGGSKLRGEKNISGIIPQHRNSLIAGILALLGITQGIGTGFDKIAYDYKDADELHRPFVNSDDFSFTLVLPDLTYKRGVVSTNVPFPEVYLEAGNLPENGMKILSYCYNARRSVAEIAKAINVQVSSYLRNQIIGSLVQKGFLVTSQEKPVRFLSNHELVKLKP